MPTTLLDGETWDQAYARRFREEHWEIVMEDEMNKAVDTSYGAVCSALILLGNVGNQIERSRELAQETENSDVEFKYAKIAGQLIGVLDVLDVSIEIIGSRLQDAAAAIRYLKGVNDE